MLISDNLKKNVVSLIGVLAVMSLTACGNNPDISEETAQSVRAEQEVQTVQAEQEAQSVQTEQAVQSVQTEQEAQIVQTEQAVQTVQTEQEAQSVQTEQEEQTVQADERPVMTADELLDSFINGQVSAVSSADSTSTFYMTDLNMDSEEWDSYSVGEKVDLDNDGENELILCGPYGGRYLDARDNKVYEFAAGEGTGLTLSYTVYNGATWIMYSNRMNAGYELFHLEKFEGADNLVGEMDFGSELIDGSDIESGMRYTLNGTEISYDEFEKLASKICAAEVYTN